MLSSDYINKLQTAVELSTEYTNQLSNKPNFVTLFKKQYNKLCKFSHESRLYTDTFTLSSVNNVNNTNTSLNKSFNIIVTRNGDILNSGFITIDLNNAFKTLYSLSDNNINPVYYGLLRDMCFIIFSSVKITLLMGSNVIISNLMNKLNYDTFNDLRYVYWDSNYMKINLDSLFENIRLIRLAYHNVFFTINTNTNVYDKLTEYITNFIKNNEVVDMYKINILLGLPNLIMESKCNIIMDYIYLDIIERRHMTQIDKHEQHIIINNELNYNLGSLNLNNNNDVIINLKQYFNNITYNNITNNITYNNITNNITYIIFKFNDIEFNNILSYSGTVDILFDYKSIFDSPKSVAFFQMHYMKFLENKVNLSNDCKFDSDPRIMAYSFIDDVDYKDNYTTGINVNNVSQINIIFNGHCIPSTNCNLTNMTLNVIIGSDKTITTMYGISGFI